MQPLAKPRPRFVQTPKHSFPPHPPHHSPQPIPLNPPTYTTQHSNPKQKDAAREASPALHLSPGVARNPRYAPPPPPPSPIHPPTHPTHPPRRPPPQGLSTSRRAARCPLCRGGQWRRRRRSPTHPHRGRPCHPWYVSLLPPPTHPPTHPPTPLPTSYARTRSDFTLADADVARIRAVLAEEEEEGGGGGGQPVSALELYQAARQGGGASSKGGGGKIITFCKAIVRSPSSHPPTHQPTYPTHPPTHRLPTLRSNRLRLLPHPPTHPPTHPQGLDAGRRGGARANDRDTWGAREWEDPADAAAVRGRPDPQVVSGPGEQGGLYW